MYRNSIDGGVSAPVEAAAENQFDDEVIGRGGGADADTEVDLPERRDIEVGDDEELLLLVVHGGDVAYGVIIGVILDPTADYRGEIVADLGAGREAPALIDVGAVQRAFQCRVDRKVPAADRLVDDGPHLPGPGVRREGGALEADLGGQADTHRPIPGVGYPNTRADVIADPLDALAVLLGGEDIEPDFGPVREAFGQLDSLVLLMVGRQYSIDDVLLAVDGEVGMQLHHQGFRGNGVGAVDLDLVVRLSSSERRHCGQQQHEPMSRPSHPPLSHS